MYIYNNFSCAIYTKYLAVLYIIEELSLEIICCSCCIFGSCPAYAKLTLYIKNVQNIPHIILFIVLLPSFRIFTILPYILLSISKPKSITLSLHILIPIFQYFCHYYVQKQLTHYFYEIFYYAYHYIL